MTLEVKSKFNQAHYSMSKFLRSYDFICPRESYSDDPIQAPDTQPADADTDRVDDF